MTQVSQWCSLVTHLPTVLELCYHTLVTADRKCQLLARHISLIPEQRNSQLDKEGLSLFFEVCKFHKYLEERKFRIQTDHEPFLGLLVADCPILVMSSPRAQHWAVTLTGYTYDNVYQWAVNHGNANFMSKLLAPGFVEESPVPADMVLTLEQLDTPPITSAMVWEWTRKDPVLAQVV